MGRWLTILLGSNHHEGRSVASAVWLRMVIILAVALLTAALVCANAVATQDALSGSAETLNLHSSPFASGVAGPLGRVSPAVSDVMFELNIEAGGEVEIDAAGSINSYIGPLIVDSPVPSGTVFVLRAKASAGWGFTGYTGAIASSSTAVSFVVSSSEGSLAKFTKGATSPAPPSCPTPIGSVPITQHLYASAGGDASYDDGTTGTATAGKEIEYQVQACSTDDLTASPETGFDFSKWEGPVSGNSTTTSYVVQPPSGGTLVEALFVPAPKIDSFASSCSGSLSSSGGDCTLEWVLSNTTTCMMSSSPDVLSGSVYCGDGGTDLYTVSFPANTSGSPETYTFTLTAEGASGTTPVMKQTTVTVAPRVPEKPQVVTEAATGISQTGATLNGTVNPEGSNVTSCTIEYGTTTSYGSSVPCSPSPGSGTSAVSVSAAVTGLTASTTYDYRVVAENAGGKDAGANETFTTKPTPSTLGVSPVPDVSSPTIIVSGTGFGTAAATSSLFHKSDVSPFVKLIDASQGWEAGGYTSDGEPDECTVTIGSWTPTRIILSAQVNEGFLHPCNFGPNDTLKVYVWPTGDTETTPLEGETQVVGAQGGAPVVSQVTPGFGPVSGGTATSSTGEVTIAGSQLSDAEAVWFGAGYAMSPVSSSSAAVDVVPPPVGSAEGVQVQVATPAGTSGRSLICVLQTGIGCNGAYFYMAGAFGPHSEAIKFNCSAGDSGYSCTTANGTQFSFSPPGPSTPPKCSGSPEPQTSFDLGLSGTATIETRGNLGISTNNGIPTAIVGDGSIELQSMEFTVSGNAAIGDTLMLPIPLEPYLTPCVDDLYLVFNPSVAVSGESTFSVNHLAMTANGSWIDGAGQLDSLPSVTCDGAPLTLDNVGDCITYKPSVSTKLNYVQELLFQVGDDELNVGVGLGAGVSAGIDSNLSPSSAYVDACTDIGWEATAQVPGLGWSLSAGGPLLGPYNIYASEPDASTECPLGSVTPTTAEATGTNSVSLGPYTEHAVGQGSISLGEYASDPVDGGVPPSNSTVAFFDAAMAPGSQYTSVSVDACGDADPDSGIEWWNPSASAAGGSWEAVTPTPTYEPTTGCLGFTIGSTTSPSLNQFGGTVFAIIAWPESSPNSQPSSTVPPASGVLSTKAVAGAVALDSKTITMVGHKAKVKLMCTGTTTCRGKLSLTVKQKIKRGKGTLVKTETIGTAAFSIGAGKTGVVTLALNTIGRALVKTDHGRLNATLTIVKSSPSPSSTQHASVHLILRTANSTKRRASKK